MFNKNQGIINFDNSRTSHENSLCISITHVICEDREIYMYQCYFLFSTLIIGVIKRPLNICVKKLDGILVKKETLPAPPA